MKTSERLLARLRAEGIIPDTATAEIHRVNPSRSQRVTGAWSWCVIWHEGGRERDAGSQFPMATILHAETLDTRLNEWDQLEIDPARPGGVTQPG